MGGPGQYVVIQPLRQAELVQSAGLLRCPRRIEGNRLAHMSQLEQRRTEVQRRPRAHRPRNRARVAVLLAVYHHDGLTVGVLLVTRYPELVHQCVDPVLPRSYPRATAIDPRPVGTHFGERAPAEPVAGFQHRYRSTRLFQPQCGRQSCEACADHAIVDICHGEPSSYRSSAHGRRTTSARSRHPRHNGCTSPSIRYTGRIFSNSRANSEAG